MLNITLDLMSQLKSINLQIHLSMVKKKEVGKLIERVIIKIFPTKYLKKLES